MQTRMSPQNELSQAHQASLPSRFSNDSRSLRSDTRNSHSVQRHVQNLANASHRSTQLKTLQTKMQGKADIAQRVEEEEPLQGKFETVQRVEEEEPLQGKFDTAQRVEEEEPMQGKFETAQRKEQAKPNNTGLPNQLKSGIESMSGMSMDHVKVHYNSDKPAQLNAHAYAQGSEIHVAPGQEKHLPHEAWHVVQQAQGRVKPTMQMKAGVPVNDDVSLETEADVMGEKALQMHAVNSNSSFLLDRQVNEINPPVQRLLKVAGTNYRTLLSFQQSDSYNTVLDWLKTEDKAIGKKGYETTLAQYVSSEDVEEFHSLDHFKQNLLYDLRQGTWTKDSNASATVRFMTRRGWRNAANKKDTIGTGDAHATQSISLYRTMPLAEAKAIMIAKDISQLSGHMGDYAAALNYCHRAVNDRVLVEFQLKPGAHQQLFSKEKLAVVAGGVTTGHMRERYETEDSEYDEASAGEGIHREKIGAKSEVHGVAGFSLAAHGAVASDVLKPLIASIRPLLIGKQNAAPVEISKSDFVRGYSD